MIPTEENRNAIEAALKILGGLLKVNYRTANPDGSINGLAVLASVLGGGIPAFATLIITGYIPKFSLPRHVLDNLPERDDEELEGYSDADLDQAFDLIRSWVDRTETYV